MGYKVTIEHIDEGHPSVSCTVTSSSPRLGTAVIRAIERLHPSPELSQVAHDLVLGLVADTPENLQCNAGSPEGPAEERFTESLLSLAKTLDSAVMRAEVAKVEEFLQEWRTT